MFKILGVVFTCYVLYAVVIGKVVARSGPGARVVSRDDSPAYYWTVVVIYLALCIALLTYF